MCIRDRLHLGAVLPSLPFAADAHYHHLVDDVIEGGKLPYRHGTIAVPQGPGLGVRLDRERPPGTPGCTRSWATIRTTRTPAGPAGTPGCPTRSGRTRTPPRRWDGRPAGRPATRAPEAGRDRGNRRGRGSRPGPGNGARGAGGPGRLVLDRTDSRGRRRPGGRDRGCRPRGGARRGARRGRPADRRGHVPDPVSYTHLTLPTILRVYL